MSMGTKSPMDQIIAEAGAKYGVEFDELRIAGLKALAGSDLDEAGFAQFVAMEAAKLAEASGAGTPRGNGRRPTAGVVTEADLDALDDAIFGPPKGHRAAQQSQAADHFDEWD